MVSGELSSPGPLWAYSFACHSVEYVDDYVLIFGCKFCPIVCFGQGMAFLYAGDLICMGIQLALRNWEEHAHFISWLIHICLMLDSAYTIP